MQNALQWAKKRYTCKAYDASRKIDSLKMKRILSALHLAPSSVNIQPWHFLVCAQDESKARIARAMPGDYAYNRAKVEDASHVVILCTRYEISKAHIDAVDYAEAEAGRIAFSDLKNSPRHRFFANNHFSEEALFHWAECQTFIALGQLLWAANLEEVDATVIGGFDKQILDEMFALSEQGLRSSVLCSLGYRHEKEMNHQLPKSRLPESEIFSFF